MYSVVTIAPGIEEGIKVDGSFFQHGQQLYGGGYGKGFTMQVLGFISWTVNTSMYIGSAELSAFGTLTLDGQQWSMFADYLDYSIIGRDITHPVAPNDAAISPEEISQITGPRHSEYVLFASRLSGKGPPLLGNKHFWKGDYMVHRRDNYMTSVRMHSTRTYNSECVNEEGKLSLHLGDGVNYLYLNAMKEYGGIFGAWNWDRLPGTTNAPGTVPLQCDTLKTLGTTSYVGGVSDGLYGVAAYDFQAPLKGKVSALKAWFFFDDAYVCLGTAITSGYNDVSVGTFIDQKLLQGPVYTSSSPTTPLASGHHPYPPSANLKWVHHGDVGYIFPQQSPQQYVNVTLQQQTGNWNEIGATTLATTVQVFDLAIDHGYKNVKDVSYAYITVPAINVTSFSSSYASLAKEYTIICNTEEVQAVVWQQSTNASSSTHGTVLGVVFWRAGTINAGPGLKIAASQPISVLVVVNEKESLIQITVSNPSQNPSYNYVTVSIDRKLSGAALCSSSGVINFDLPAGDNAGKSISQTCKYLL
eukprot:TRINITY_DN8993_c0_g1_i3.p1 TRINITY_DN8993_c0_g1~~TRINITY_DN8993_c0_g1_i3.p1  ORF type:complete len:529 (-),score=94.83 TRINITY_DN8993_c0_g1_i3:51-1637(-)